jgi:hypothetical protein
MLSPTQKNKVATGISNLSEDLPVYEQDRFPFPPEYPCVQYSVIAQNIKSQFTTAGPIHEEKNTQTKDWDFWVGDLCKATFSCMINVKAPGNSTTDEIQAQTELDALTFDFVENLRFDGLGLNWFDDRIKLVKIENVTPIKPTPDVKPHSWIHRNNVDFTIEYEFSKKDNFPGIKSFGFDLSSPECTDDHGYPLSSASLPEIVKYAPGYYGMDIIIWNDKVTLRMSVLLTNKRINTHTMSMKVV